MNYQSLTQDLKNPTTNYHLALTFKLNFLNTQHLTLILLNIIVIYTDILFLIKRRVIFLQPEMRFQNS